jgi:hypothetical protein
MNSLNSKISERLSLLAVISPVSQGVGAATSGWVDMRDMHRLLAVIQTGVLGTAATVDAKLQQATSSGGAGAKDISGKAITQLVKASNDNNQATIDLLADELDVANSFRYVQLSITVGAAASLIAGQVLGQADQLPASAFNPAAVVQQV